MKYRFDNIFSKEYTSTQSNFKIKYMEIIITSSDDIMVCIIGMYFTGICLLVVSEIIKTTERDKIKKMG
ncbi:hypothetical protein H6790_02390 [Candidatus Nomurabacteria bacterium]|nr:hypothetical protein [Candidatus Nomurabacteria bacterium]